MKKSTIFLLIVLLSLIYIYFINETNSRISALNNTQQVNPLDSKAVCGTDFIYTSNYANKTLNYYYYIPNSIAKNSNKAVPFLIMVPGLSGDGKDFVTDTFKNFAQKEGFVIISPSFKEDDANWESKTSYQYPAAWSGQALNTILNSFTTKQKFTPSAFYLLGFSAGAQFVARYSLIYPNYIKACVINAAGGADFPVKYQATQFYYAVGAQDERKDVAQLFYNRALELGINITYKEYPNIDHVYSSDEINDELSFIRNIKNSNK